MTEDCPICDAPGTRVRERREVKLGRRAAEVEHELYRCPECDEAWYTPDQMDRAQQLAADQIRDAEGLLAPDAIRGIRDALDLSQADFERLLGFGTKTVGRWERGTVIPNASSDLLIRLVGSLPEVVRFLAGRVDVSLSGKLRPELPSGSAGRTRVGERRAHYPGGAGAMNEHDLAVLDRGFPDHGLERGDLGTIVHVYTDGEAYEVEFALASGETVAVLTLDAADVRPRTGREILHSRTLG